MEIFEAWPVVLFIVAGLLGLVVGSFLNVVAYRVPIMLERDWRAQCEELKSELRRPPHVPSGRFNLWWPRSACPRCGAPIAAQHNVPGPELSVARGPLRGCGAKISRRYPLVEALRPCSASSSPPCSVRRWQTVAALGFTWTLLALTLIDLDRKLLPDSLTLPLLWAGLIVNALVGGAGLFAPTSIERHRRRRPATSTLWSVYQLFKLVTGKEGMGYGDFKLLAAIGAWLGWQLLPLVILLSAAVGTSSARPDRVPRALAPHADPVRPLPCRGGLDRAAVGDDSCRSTSRGLSAWVRS